MTNKVYYNERQIRSYVQRIIFNMNRDAFKPDYVVGITRGGLVPAVLLSEYMEIPMHTLKVSLRDNPETESNCWMADDALGYDTMGKEVEPKKILIMDDINDTGATLNWIKEDWRDSCFPKHPRWETTWGNNVRTAVLIENIASNFKTVDYVGHYINKEDVPEWCVFPWEDWWKIKE
jgi:uncharacterized protein